MTKTTKAQRSARARKAWETRRANAAAVEVERMAEAARRSERARKAWATRRASV